MTPREKLIENIVALINTTAILTIDDSCDGFPEPDLVNTDEIAEAIINYLKLEVVDNKTKAKQGDLISFGNSYIYLNNPFWVKVANDMHEKVDISLRKGEAVINIDNL